MVIVVGAFAALFIEHVQDAALVIVNGNVVVGKYAFPAGRSPPATRAAS